MKYLDTRVRIVHACPFCDISRRHPEVEFALWCSRLNVVMQVTANTESSLRNFLRDAKTALKTRHVVRSGTSALVMMTSHICQTYDTITKVASNHNCWVVPPETYYGGWETQRIISPGKEALRGFISDVKKMGQAEMVSHASREQVGMLSDLIVPVHFFEGLTPKQVKSLVLAYENGLFELPANVKLETLAKQMHLSRSTLGEHIRKAQLQILKNSYPLLKLRSLEQRPEGSLE